MVSVTAAKPGALPYLGALLLLVPIPLGMRTSELSLVVLAGVVMLLAGGHIRHTRVGSAFAFLAIGALGALISVVRGDAINWFQVFRGSLFLLLVIWLMVEEFDDELMAAIERLIPILLVAAFVSAVAYFALGLNLYNSTLDLPYDESEYKRLYVFPTYFFMILLFDEVRKGRAIQYLYAGVLLITASKALFLSLACIYMWKWLGAMRLRNIAMAALGMGLMSALAVATGVLDRALEFVEVGDPWRALEPVMALLRLMDPLRAIFGNGMGIAYWGGWGTEVDVTDDSLRVIVNSMFDVHNGIVTVLLRFGIPGGILYLYYFVRSVPRVSGWPLLVLILVLNVALSHGPIQTVEAVGLALGLQVIRYRERVAQSSAISLSDRESTRSANLAELNSAH